MFCRWPVRDRRSTCLFHRSGLRRTAADLLCRLLTSAPRSRPPCDALSPVAETRRRSPEVRPTAFAARPPDLPPRSLMTVDFAIICSLVRPGRPRYPVLVHRAAALLHASFRPHLATTPLRFANPSPPSGWIEDFHLQAVDHARHTRKAPPKRGSSMWRAPHWRGRHILSVRKTSRCPLQNEEGRQSRPHRHQTKIQRAPRRFVRTTGAQRHAAQFAHRARISTLDANGC